MNGTYTQFIAYPVDQSNMCDLVQTCRENCGKVNLP
jgi:hypothetical protein